MTDKKHKAVIKKSVHCNNTREVDYLVLFIIFPLFKIFEPRRLMSKNTDIQTNQFFSRFFLKVRLIWLILAEFDFF